MSWVKLDDGFPDHPKAALLSDAAFRGYITGLCYCARYLTDGFIPEAIARRFATKKVSSELIAGALWEPADLGFRVHDYLEYNPNRDSILARRAADSARKSGGKATDSATIPTVPSSTHSPPVTPRPDPVLTPVLLNGQTPRVALGFTNGEWESLYEAFPGVNLNQFWREWVEWVEKSGERAPKNKVGAFRGFVTKKIAAGAAS